MATPVGQRVLHYTILAKIGEGGMGLVYKARDTRLDRVVALKFLTAGIEDNSALSRFLQEAKAASALNHPNIVTIYDVNNTDGLHFIAMEFVEGQILSDRIRAEPGLSLTESLKLGAQLADALAAAHRAGIIHRDLKPNNLMVTPSGLLKVLDFGLAKMRIPAALNDLTMTRTEPGTILGTPAYMSPEQAKGDTVDARSDIFSAACVLYEMITRQSPFRRESAVATFAALLRDEPAPLRQFLPDAPRELEDLLFSCLRKQPNERPQDADHVRDALQNVLLTLTPGQTPSRRMLAVADVSHSIAVLPFTDMSPQKDEEYFCDGISEEIIAALGKLPNTRVVGRTSSFFFKGRPESLPQIGAQLRVNLVLAGSVRKAGERVRITAELINAADGYQLWSERFDSEMKGVFELQDEIATAVARRLQVKLAEAPAARLITRHTENLEAYNLYLRGRYVLGQRTKQSHEAAVRYFEKAIELDPGYAPAYAALADAWVIIGIYWAPAKTALPKARSAALTAVQIRDTLAEAHASLAFTYAMYDWDLSLAAQEFRRAIDLNSDYANAHSWYGLHVLGVTGRFDEAVRELETALRLDPLSPPLYLQFGTLRYHQREFAKAIELLEKFLEMSPLSSMGFKLLAFMYRANGDHAGTLATVRRAVKALGDTPSAKAFSAYEAALTSTPEAALTIANELIEISKTAYVPEMDLVYFYILMDDRERALDWLEQAFEQRSPVMIHLDVAPVFDPLRAEPRFQAILKRVGF